MSASRRLTRSVSRSTARRSAVALTAAVGLTGVALVAPASAAVPHVARFAVGPFAQADEESTTPVTVDVRYELDGERISADDVEGKTGLLEVTYLVRNRTTTPTELTYKDGQGNDITETVDLVAPYVGRLAVALPSRSGDVTAEGAEVLDGGVAWSMVLFNPLGEPAQQLKLSMQVSDAQLPAAELQVAKVNPTDGGVLTKGTKAAQETSASSSTLTQSVFKIDSSVLKLRDGATQLFDGLVQLADGSAALEEGLAGKAAPGAQKLSDGLGSAREGGGTLSEGLGKLAAGSKTLGTGLNSAATGGKALSNGLDQLVSGGGRLIAGLNSAADGGGKLAEGLRSSSGEPDLAGGTKSVADGLATVSGGLSTLSAGLKALPQNPGIAQLKGALAQVQAGVGGLTDVATPTTANPTLLGATQALKFGMRNPAGLSAFECSTTPGAATSCGIGDVAERISAGLKAAGESNNDGLNTLITDAKNAYALDGCPVADVGTSPVPGIKPPVDPTLSQICALSSKIVFSLALPANTGIPGLPAAGGVLAQTQTSKTSLLEASAGLTAVKTGVDTSVIPTLNAIRGGLSNPGWDLNGNGAVDAGEKPGIKEVQAIVSAGIDQLVKGIVDGLSAGVDGQLAPGVNLLAAGSKTLAEKTALAADGAATLRGGLNELAAGGGTLAAGAGAAATGAKTLSGGLDQLAAGGGTLVAGLDAANAGGAKLADGLGQLDDGAATLATGLNDAADGSGKLADGIVKVKDGVESLKNGAGELSGRGTSALGGSVNASARNNALKVAMLEAIATMGEDTANEPSFDIVLAGASSDADDDGIGSAALLGGAAVLALLTMAAAGLLVARRRNGASHSVA